MWLGLLCLSIQPGMGGIVGRAALERAQTGADLNPLSEFKAADVLLAGRDGRPEMLSDNALFLEAFMGFALDTIQASVLPTQMIDSITFGNIVSLADLAKDLAAASGGDVLSVRNQQRAFAGAQKQRTEKIQGAINSLKTSQQNCSGRIDYNSEPLWSKRDDAEARSGGESQRFYCARSHRSFCASSRGEFESSTN